MTQDLFERLTLHNFHDDAFRNIMTIRETQDLYDDLSADPADWDVAIAAEMAVKPPYTQHPIIERPFEEAIYQNAIEFPFKNWMESRYSDGHFGVWYGAANLETTVHETVHHWRRMLDAVEEFPHHDTSIVGERRVFLVRCDAALLDFRVRIADFPSLVEPHDYRFTQEAGRRVHHEGHPGIVTKSAHCEGDMFAILRQSVLSNPRNCCDLTYKLDTASGRVTIERQVGTTMMVVNL